MSRRSVSSVSTFQVIFIVVLLLTVGIALAIALAPDKPEAPPASKIAYDERPEQKKAPKNRDTGDTWMPSFRTARAERLAIERAENADAATAPEEFPYHVRGTVVDARTGEPIAFARIGAERVWTVQEETSWSERNQVAVRDRDEAMLEALAEEERDLSATGTTKTDEQGVFQVGVPSPGEYDVTAFIPQYIRTTERTAMLNDETPDAEVTIKLSTGASISGRVTEAGTGKGAFELPVQIENASEYRVFTDENGDFTISGLEPGSYGVLVVTRNTQYMATSKVPYQRVQVADAAQDVQNINFTVEPAGVVWGYVYNPNKEAIPGADVVVATGDSVLSQAFTALVSKERPVTARSAEDGYYELLGVPLNREWQVYATSDKYAPQLADPFILTGGNRNVRIDIYMTDGTTIYGAVVEPDGAPIPEAQVVCFPSYTKLLSPIDSPHAFRRVTTDANGIFQIDEIPQGNYQILARKDGFKFSAMGEPIYPDGYNDIKNFNVVLYPADEGEHSVFGTVVNQHGEPVGGAKCVLSGMGSESMNTFSRETSSDNAGKFTIDGVEVGMYRLTVSAEGYAPSSVPRVLLDAETKVLLDTAALLRGRVLVRETEQPPQTPYTVKALLLGELTPDGGSSFIRLNQNAVEQTFQRPDGSFQISLPAGYYRLEGKAENMTPGRLEMAVEGGQVRDDVTLYVSTEGARIEGRVVSIGGRAIDGAQVSLVDSGTGGSALGGALGAGDQSMHVGADGFFSFNKLPASTYNLVATHPEYANGSEGPIVLAEGQVVDDVEIKMGSGGVLVGNISRGGKPLVGALVLIVGSDTGTTRSVTTDDTGYYETDGLASGRYEVTVTQMSTGQVTDLFDRMGGSVEVTEGQVARLDLGGNEGVNITGTAFPAPPGFGGEVFLRTPGSPLPAPIGEPLQPEDVLGLSSVAHVSVQPGTGAYSFENIQPGFYQLEVYYVMNIMTGDVRCVYAGQIEVPSTTQIDVPIQVEVYKK